MLILANDNDNTQVLNTLGSEADTNENRSDADCAERTERRAEPRFLALPPINPELCADFSALEQLASFVNSLDLTYLRRSYKGFGSDAWPVEHLLLLALFCIHENRPSPSQWGRDAVAHQQKGFSGHGDSRVRLAAGTLARRKRWVKLAS